MTESGEGPEGNRHVGYVDVVENGVVHGWCRSTVPSPLPVTIRIAENERPVASGIADLFRGDLLVLGGDGRHGFAIALPESLWDGKPHLLTAAVAEDGAPLTGSPFTFCFIDTDRAYQGEVESASAERATDISLDTQSIDLTAARASAEDSAERIEAIGERLEEILRANRQALHFNKMATEGVRALRSAIGRIEQRVDAVGDIVASLAPAETVLPDGLLAEIGAATAAFNQLTPLLARFGALAGGNGMLVDQLKGHFPMLTVAPQDEPVVSIVIPAFNQFFHTYQCLRALSQHPPAAPFEIILVDDASTDETVLAEHVLSGITILRNPVNAGFIESCNRGAERARGDFLLFLNNDTIPQPGAIDELYGTFDLPEIGEHAGLVGAKLIYPDGSLQEAGAIVWNDASAWNYGRGSDAAHCDYNYLRSVDYCSGAAIMLRKEEFESVGGFDPLYRPAFYEDTDLAFKLRERGRQVYYQPLATIIHHEGVSCGRDPETGIKAFQTRNAKLFRERWSETLKSHRPNGAAPLLERDRGVTRRILVIDATTPEIDRDAGSNVTYAQMRILQSMGFKVTFIPEDNFAFIPIHTPALQRRGIECIHHPYWSNMESFLAARGDEFDLVYLHRFAVAEKCLPLLRRHAPKAAVLFNNADLHYLRMEREARLRSSAAALKEMRTVRERELAVARAVDCTIVCNSVEQTLLAEAAPEARIHYFPWAIEPPPLDRPGFEAREGFLFLGGFGHAPNLDAVDHFLCDVMPLLRRKLPHVRFYIYGSSMPETLRRLASAEIVPVGHVADLADIFDRHRLSIAPLRYGAGFKGKVVTSLAYGVPVVASPIAAEGTGLIPGQHLLIAEDPESFATALAALYTDKALWSRLAAAGRVHVEEVYSFERGRQHFSDIFRQIGRADLGVSSVVQADFASGRRSDRTSRS